MTETIPLNHWTFMDDRFIKDSSFNFTKSCINFQPDFFGLVIPNEDLMNNKQKSDKKCKRIRTKDEVIQDIITLTKKNRKLLNHKILLKTNFRSLVYAANKYFGTWNNAIIASNEKPLYKKWSKEKVISEIKKIHTETGKVPNFGVIRRSEDTSLINAARLYFGSWSNAIKFAGLKPYRNDFWTKETLIQELRGEILKLGEVPSKRELHRIKRFDLVSSGSKFFGSYNKFLKISGFKPVLIQNKWTKERIKKTIIEIANKLKRTPTERDMISFGLRTVIMASLRQFSGWNNAIITSGLKPNESFVNDKSWKTWENLALEICKKIYPDSKKHKKLPNNKIPDFYDKENDLIIEIKLNSSDTTIHKDIINYKNYCKRIEIWYIVGKPIETLSNKIIFRGPKQIRKIIKDIKDELLMERLNKIIKEVTSCDKK